MKVVDCVVESAVDGTKVPAQRIVCEYDDNDEWILLVIAGHNHIQCTWCNRSYCQNAGICNLEDS